MKSKSFYFRAALVFAAFVFLIVPTSAQTTAAPEKVWTLTYLKAKPGQAARLVQFLEKNWLALDQIAVERKLITSYRLIQNQDAANQDWDAVVVVEYPTPQG